MKARILAISGLLLIAVASGAPGAVAEGATSPWPDRSTSMVFTVPAHATYAVTLDHATGSLDVSLGGSPTGAYTTACVAATSFVYMFEPGEECRFAYKSHRANIETTELVCAASTWCEVDGESLTGGHRFYLFCEPIDLALVLFGPDEFVTVDCAGELIGESADQWTGYVALCQGDVCTNVGQAT